MNNKIINWARKLQAIANNGLLYSETIYHQERYEALQDIALEMFAESSTITEVEAKAIFSQVEGYATPKIDVRAVVPNDGKLLFVCEKDDNHWSLPGGWVEIGSTIKDTIKKEVLDESGYMVNSLRLLGIYDKDLYEDEPTSPYQVYTIYVLCGLLNDKASEIKLETSRAKFFGRNEIPPISKNRISIKHVVKMFEYIENSNLPSEFD